MPNYSGFWTLAQQAQAKAANNWTAPPNAPTIGTATGANTSASVTFTAPAYTGNPAGITSFTVTSSPSGITGTGASSPITVSGLSNGTAYTFTVTATGAGGTGSASAASNSVTPAPAIGDAFEGGFYTGQIGISGVATHYLVVAPVSSGQSTLTWKNAQSATPGADSDIDGPQNTADMVADGNSTVYPCAHFCNDATIGGYTDWYMPALNELEISYYNLKPTTAANNVGSGINPNAVPARASTYTSGDPAQTLVANFITSSGAEAFASAKYWCSTELSATRARRQDLNNGIQYDQTKTTSYRVRAVRRVAV